MLDLRIARLAPPAAGALVLPIEEGGGVEFAGLDAATQSAITRALEVAEFKGKKGQTTVVLAPGGGLSRVVAVGLGKRGEITPLIAEEAGGHAIAHLAREEKVSLAAGPISAAQAAHLALGAVLRSYRFDRYRTTEKAEDKSRLTALALLVDNTDAAQAAWAKLKP